MTKKKTVESDVVEPVEVVAPAVTPEPVVQKAPTVHVVQPGDTYPLIAGLYKPKNLTKHEYAVRLFEKNKGMSLTIGTEVIL